MSRTTNLPALARSMSTSLIASWAIARPYGILAASMTSTCGGSSASSSCGASRSATTTSAWASRRLPRTVISSGSPGPPPTSATPPCTTPGRLGRDEALLQRLVDGRPDRRRPAVLAAGQHPDRQPFVLERGGCDGGALAGHVGAHAEDVQALGLGDDGGVDVRVVGGRDRIPGAVEVSVAKLPERQGDSRHALDGRGGAAGDDVHVGTVGDQQRQAALRDGTAADDDDLLAGQAQADEVGVLGHPASLEVAAAATKRVIACGCAAGWVCRYDACTPRSTAPSRTLAMSRPAYTHAGG